MSIEQGSFDPTDPEKKDKVKYNAVVVSPSYEDNKHESGLWWDSRLRLLAAEMVYESGQAGRVVVGGDQIREMKKPFSKLMKNNLVKRGVPSTKIDTEEHTYDTPSQMEWLKQHIAEYGNNVAYVTDPEQAKHVKALLKGFELEGQVHILTTEDIIRENGNNKHLAAFIEKLHKSPYWKQWKLREKVLELITRYVDPKGEKLKNITGRRKQK